MSELPRGPGLSGRPPNNNGGSRMAAGQDQGGSPRAPPSGIRTPRDVWQARQNKIASEARKRAEAEGAAAAAAATGVAATDTQPERSSTDEQRRRRPDYSGVTAPQAPPAPPAPPSSQPQPAFRDSGYRSAARTSDRSTRNGNQQQAAAGYTYASQPPNTSRQQSSAARSGYDYYDTADPDSLGADPAAASAGQPQPRPRATSGRAAAEARGNGNSGDPVITSTGSSGAQGGAADRTTASGGSRVSSFPHAFERWETLSSRWEGLTSYWLRRLEQSTGEITGDPTTQQMSRQITDLSAAGANLFHGLVELQKLRASSERKFQRWFFETREAQEQMQVEISRLRDTLEAERQARARAPVDDQLTARQQRTLAENRRELQIAKDEARRAWEELGRREEIDRHHYLALKDGQAINIGGIQVLPHSAPGQAMYQQRQQQQQQQQRAGQEQQATSPRRQGQYEEQDRQRYQQAPEGGEPPLEPSPTSTDPFSASGPPRRTNVQAFGGEYPPGAPAQQHSPTPAQVRTDPSPSQRFYTQPSAQQAYAQQQRQGDEDPAYDPALPERSIPMLGSVSAAMRPSATAAAVDPRYAQQQQYGAEDYRSAREDPGLDLGDDDIEIEDDDDDGLPQTHHHPSRLSAVMEEEDERARAGGQRGAVGGVAY